MLKHLQKSVEEEELVWKSKMANSEEQLRVVSWNTSLKITFIHHLFKPLPHFFFLNLLTVPLTHYQAEEKASKLEAENQSVEQVGICPHLLEVS